MFSLCFWQFLTAFPLFSAQKKIAPGTLSKRAMCVICSFHEWMLFCSFSYKKTSNLLKKPWANSQPWFLNQNRRYLAFSQLYQGQTTSKCIKFEKSLKLTHSILYTLHKTLYSLEIVHHAADRGLSFFFLLSRVHILGMKDEGRLLSILYELYILWYRLYCSWHRLTENVVE